MWNKKLVIGIDGGGSNTRVAVSNKMGKLLAYHVYPKAASQLEIRITNEIISNLKQNQKLFEYI